MSCPSCSRSSRPACAGNCDSGVTAVIGTIMVLGITVIGIAATLLLGAPVIQQLQEEAAVETMVGQMQTVRSAVQTLAVPPASRLTGITPSDGTLSLTDGSHWLVTVLHNADTDCAFAVDGWSDWDSGTANALIVTGTACGATGPCATVADDDCLRVHESGLTANLVTGWGGGAAATATLSEDLASGVDYNIVLNGPLVGGSPAILAEAWLLHSDRIAWTRGTSEVIYEGGTIFTRENGQLYRIAGPRVDEGEDGESLLLSLPTFRASAYGAIAGSGDHAVYTELASRDVLVDTLGDNNDPRLVTIDVHDEDWAQAWCNTFLQRNTFADLGEEPWQEAAQAADECDADPGAADGVRSVRFVLDPADPDAAFILTRSVVTVALQV